GPGTPGHRPEPDGQRLRGADCPGRRLRVLPLAGGVRERGARARPDRLDPAATDLSGRPGGNAQRALPGGGAAAGGVAGADRDLKRLPGVGWPWLRAWAAPARCWAWW